MLPHISKYCNKFFRKNNKNLDFLVGLFLSLRFESHSYQNNNLRYQLISAVIHLRSSCLRLDKTARQSHRRSQVTKDGSGQARPPRVRLEPATATERSVVAYHESQFLIPLSGAFYPQQFMKNQEI